MAPLDVFDPAVVRWNHEVTEDLQAITRCSFPDNTLSRMLCLRHLLEIYNNSQCGLASTVHGECSAPSSEDETLGCSNLQEWNQVNQCAKSCPDNNDRRDADQLCDNTDLHTRQVLGTYERSCALLLRNDVLNQLLLDHSQPNFQTSTAGSAWLINNRWRVHHHQVNHTQQFVSIPCRWARL